MWTAENLTDEAIRELHDALVSGRIRWNEKLWHETRVALGYGIASTPTDAGRGAYRECRARVAKYINARAARTEGE